METCSHDPNLMDSFLEFTDGPSIHELAHLICCADEHVMDPLWGEPFKTSFAGPGFGGRRELFAEVKVLSIQERMDEYWVGNKEPNPELITAMIGYTSAKADGVTRRAIRAQAVEHIGTWTIQAVWNELERKKGLIDAILVS